MNTHRSVRISIVPRSQRRPWTPRSNFKVTPISNKEQYTNSNSLSPKSLKINLPFSRNHHFPPTTQNRRKTVADRKKKCILVVIIGFALLAVFMTGAILAAIYSSIPIKATTTSSNFITTTGATSVATTVTTLTTSTTTTTTTTSFLYRWNSTGITLAGLTGSVGTNSSQLATPYGMALDSSNTLFIADRNNNRVQKFVTGSSTGTTVAGQSNGTGGLALDELNQPSDVDIDSNGNIYVVDSHNDRVIFWPINSTMGTIVAGNGIAGTSNNQLDTPYGIAHDWSSNIFYITDQNNHRVMRYFSNSTSGTVVAGNNGPGLTTTQLNYPLGIYFDSSSNSLLIVNWGAHNIVRWILGASSWTLVIGTTGSAGSTSTFLSYPYDVTCDPVGNVYVADSGNDRIQFFLASQSNGTTIAGVTGTVGSTSTLLNQPTAIAVDAQFNIYVVDYGNSRIQEFLHY